jgi:anti-sigma factor RsiW
MIEPVGEAELDAYIDDQLEPARRLEVEDYLAARPALAAQVMADLSSRAALRLAYGSVRSPAPERIVKAAGRLERGLEAREFRASLRRGLAAVLLVGLGWSAHLLVSLVDVNRSATQPAFVSDALHAYRTELLRADMASQSHAASYDPQEILAKTRIAMPKLQPNWAVTDVQVFPSREGPSIEATIQAGPLGQLSLFASRSGSEATINPTLARSGTETAIYWQAGPLVYALIGTGTDSALRAAASTMVGAAD